MNTLNNIYLRIGNTQFSIMKKKHLGCKNQNLFSLDYKRNQFLDKKGITSTFQQVLYSLTKNEEGELPFLKQREVKLIYLNYWDNMAT